MSLVLLMMFVTALYWAVTRGFTPRVSAQANIPASPSPQAPPSLLPTSLSVSRVPESVHALLEHRLEEMSTSCSTPTITLPVERQPNSSPDMRRVVDSGSSVPPPPPLCSLNEQSIACAVIPSGINQSTIAVNICTSAVIEPTSEDLIGVEVEFEVTRELIGSGLFGDVDLGICGGKDVAIKHAWLEVDDADVLASNQLAYRREVRAALSLAKSHAMFVLATHWWKSGEANVTVMPAMAMDLNESVETKGAYSFVEALMVVRQILRGLIVMNQAGLIHGDLKPANILLLDGSDLSSARIADFGTAVTYNEAAEEGYIGGGSAGYAAPELIEREGAGEKCDLFAVGMVLGYLVTGKDLIPGDTTMDVLSQTLWAVSPERDWYGDEVWSVPVGGESTKELVQAMAKRDPLERVSATEALKQVKALCKTLGGTDSDESLFEATGSITDLDAIMDGITASDSTTAPDTPPTIVVTLWDDVDLRPTPHFPEDSSLLTAPGPKLSRRRRESMEMAEWVIIGSKADPIPWCPRVIPGRARRVKIRAQLTVASFKRKVQAWYEVKKGTLQDELHNLRRKA